MLGVDRAEVEADQLRHARAAAERYDAVVLLKGRHTLVAAPDGRVRVTTTGLPWLATAGAGDVLAGLVGALLAAGLDPFDAGLGRVLAARRGRDPGSPRRAARRRRRRRGAVPEVVPAAGVGRLTDAAGMDQTSPPMSRPPTAARRDRRRPRRDPAQRRATLREPWPRRS